TTSGGGGFLHDRYLFYLAPLWLIVFVYWLKSGMPRPLLGALLGAVVALALPLLLPAGFAAAGTNQFDAVATTLWAEFRDATSGIQGVDLRRLVALFVITIIAVAALAPRRWAVVLPVGLLAVFGATAGLAWHNAMTAPEREAFTGAGDDVRTWVDRRVGAHGSVTQLHLVSPRCNPQVVRNSFYLTEIFNGSVQHVASLEGPGGDSRSHERVRPLPDGSFALPSGKRLRAGYVITQTGIRLQGRRLATGTAAHLVLWKAETPDRLLERLAPRSC